VSESAPDTNLTTFSVPPELYKSAVLRIIIRPLYSLTNRAKSTGEMSEDALIWSEQLIETIPINQLKASWERACFNNKSSFAPNFFDVKNAFNELKTEIREQVRLEKELQQAEDRKLNAVAHCVEKEKHANDSGYVEIVNFFNTSEDIIAPCRACRPKAYDDWRERFIKANGDKKNDNPLPNADAVVDKILSNSEPLEDLTIAEANRLCDEHNRLIRQLVNEPDAWINLEIVFDEGANCFKLPHRADMTWSAEIIREKIESYKGRIEGL
jgi:hypothetical protein